MLPGETFRLQYADGHGNANVGGGKGSLHQAHCTTLLPKALCLNGSHTPSSLPPCVTFRLVVAPLQGPGQSPVLPFACHEWGPPGIQEEHQASHRPEACSCQPKEKIVS